MTMTDDDREFLNDIAGLVGAITGQTPEQVLANARAKAAASRARMQRANARYYAALSNVTDKQALRIDQQVSRGWRQTSQLWQNRATGNVAIMLVNDQLWNSEKGRMGKKLMMVYPDGTSNETFEKTISIRKQF